MFMPDKNPLIERAIAAVGRQADLARSMGCAQQTVSKLLLAEIQVSATQALAIHRATAGAVSASELRPDLFPPGYEPPPLAPAPCEAAE